MGVPAAGAEEPGKNSGAVHRIQAAATKGHPLRMELDPQDGPLRQLDGLREAALRPGRGPQAPPQRVHRLVVGAVDLRPRPAQGPQGRGGGPHAVEPVGIFQGLMARNILGQGSAKEDVDGLKPPADPQHRLSGGGFIAPMALMAYPEEKKPASRSGSRFREAVFPCP